MAILRNIVKNSILKIRRIEDNRDRNQTALRHLKVIEEEKGKLSPSNKKLCREYAGDVLGSKKYAPWLYVYCAYAKEFKEGWIPDNYYAQHVVPNINGNYGEIWDRKAVIDSLLQVSNSLDICYYVNYLFWDKDNQILMEDSIKTILFTKNDKVVYKLETSQQGKGIYFFNEENFDLAVIKKLGNGVFQKYIKQHEFFSNFTNNSVATIRLTSVCKDNGQIEVRAGYFRFGRSGDTHVTASALKIPVDVENGRLHENIYFGSYKSTNVLPDNNFSYANKTLPEFENCINEVIRMHSNIPYARCLGWDLMVDNNNNVLLIELNGGHSGIRFTETVQGPCFNGLNWENLHNKRKN